MIYLIWAPVYDSTSGGIIVLHRLCHELRKIGQEAYVTTDKLSSDLDTPTLNKPIENFTVIYPEIVFGNPLNAPHIVRWVLNKPGLIGGPKTYGPEENVYTFSKLFYKTDDDHVLMLPPLDLNVFYDKGEVRNQGLFYVGKGGATPRLDIPGLLEITRGTAQNPQNLSDILNHATVLYCYDNITAMADIARLCGCPVCIIPNGEYTKEEYNNHYLDWNGLSWGTEIPKIDSKKFREDYIHLKEVFNERLQKFVKETS